LVLQLDIRYFAHNIKSPESLPSFIQMKKMDIFNGYNTGIRRPSWLTGVHRWTKKSSESVSTKSAI